jgi:hypothetical protein
MVWGEASGEALMLAVDVGCEICVSKLIRLKLGYDAVRMGPACFSIRVAGILPEAIGKRSGLPFSWTSLVE